MSPLIAGDSLRSRKYFVRERAKKRALELAALDEKPAGESWPWIHYSGVRRSGRLLGERADIETKSRTRNLGRVARSKSSARRNSEALFDCVTN